jgi:hypothetical protein
MKTGAPDKNRNNDMRSGAPKRKKKNKIPSICIVV